MRLICRAPDPLLKYTDKEDDSLGFEMENEVLYYNEKICNKRPSSIQYNYRDLFDRSMSADTLSHARQRV